MAYTDDYIDPSKRATEHLNDALEKGASDEEHLVVLDEKLREYKQPEVEGAVSLRPEALETPAPKPAPTINVNEARKEDQILPASSDRQTIRLLLLTKDISVMHEGSPAHKRIADLRSMFLEIHVIVLNLEGKEDEPQVVRLFENVWLYPTLSSSWWMMGYDAYKLAHAQLVFSGGFRADVIVAEDPFESGIVGWMLREKFDRPFQLHIYEDFFDNAFIDTQEHPTFYEWSVRYLLKRVQSVRTKTEFQKQAVVREYPDLEPGTDVLPNYYNLEGWRDFAPAADLHAQYPRFKFIMLHISSMRQISHTQDVIAGAAPILKRYPTIGLVIVGAGPLRSALEKQTLALGLGNQIEFMPMPAEALSLMKTANVFIHLSEDGGEDELILQASVVRLPLIANAEGLAGTLFKDGESARLCAPSDTACIADSINMYLNENQDRARYALNASEIVFERIEQDYGAYLKAYKGSIERCVAESGEL